MFKLDLALLERLEKFSHLTQQWAGYTCFSLARVCATALFLTSLGLGVLASTELGSYAPLAITMPFGVMCSLLMIHLTHSAERVTADEHLKGRSNPYKLQLQILRYITWPSGFFGAVAILIGALYIRLDWQIAAFFFCAALYKGSMMLFFYFVSSDPLPPGTSKVRAWLESWQNASMAQLQPQ